VLTHPTVFNISASRREGGAVRSFWTERVTADSEGGPHYDRSLPWKAVNMENAGSCLLISKSKKKYRTSLS